jgi:hypothetical protein
MGAPEAVLELVERFARNRAQYLNPAYNETQVRREFLDPFFTALGWDVDNTSGHAQQYKDVVHEDAIKVGLDSRAPDYSFRVGGQRKFFVEAKKPAVNLKDDPAPASQLRRYAAEHPHRLPGACRVRRPGQARCDRQALGGAHAPRPLRAVRRTLGRDRQLQPHGPLVVQVPAGRIHRLSILQDYLA